MILAQDEMTIQRMLGCNEVPVDVHDEYLRRVRYLHRETAGGPMGPGMVVDMLRFLGYEPGVTGSDNPGMVDWRQVERGTRVRIRRAGKWTAKDVVCRFEGFVDMGTLAVELPGGYVDELNKCDVQVLSKEDIGENIGFVPDDKQQVGSFIDGTPEPDARVSLPEPEQPEPSGQEEELTADSPELQPPGPAWPPVPDWKLVKELDPVWVRERVGEGKDAEIDVHDAKFLKRIPGGKIKVKMVVGEGDELEEVERVFSQDDVRLPELG